MRTQIVFLISLLLVVSAFPAASAFAQYIPPASAPQCTDPATGAVVSCSYQPPSSTQGSSTQGSSTPRPSAAQSAANLNNAISAQTQRRTRRSSR
jgi:hypothetical protein